MALLLDRARAAIYVLLACCKGCLSRMENRLRELRGERGWSQADLAERLGVSRQTVNALERGKYDPSLPLAFRIAELFARSIEQIFSSDKDASP